MDDCTIAATRATRPIDDTGKHFAIHDEFLVEWSWSSAPLLFVSRTNPARLLSKDDFNSTVRPLSDVEDTARLLARTNATQAATVAYDPSQPPGIFSRDGARRLNTFVGTRIRAKLGDDKPFLTFMKDLIPLEGDREHLLKWIATLIARLDVHLVHGVLLISEEQGVGKGTLMEKILLPLVGSNNVSVPSEKMLTESTFNAWLGQKRLVLVHEIYSGQSKRAYNAIKSSMTEKKIDINAKYMPAYTVDNWAAFMVASNSERALKLAHNDRRWFVPRVSEKKQNFTYWKALNDWLQTGGLEAIHQWAKDYVEEHGAIEKGEEAPTSEAKSDLIFNAMSAGEKRVVALAEKATALGIGKEPKKITVTDRALRKWLADGRKQAGEPLDNLETLATIRAAAVQGGLRLHPLKHKKEGVQLRALVNFNIADDADWETIMKHEEKKLGTTFTVEDF